MTAAIEICETAFDPEARLAEFRDGLDDCGALVSFMGLVRADEGVDALELSHFEGFTQARITEIAERAQTGRALDGILIVHRVGMMRPAEPIVLVAAASKHRREAFEAADFIMDYLKSEAPFWKREHSAGVSRWIEPRDRDKIDLKRWEA